MLYSKSNYNTFKQIHQFIQKEKKIVFNLDEQFKSTLVSLVFTNLKKTDDQKIQYLQNRFSDLKNTIKGFYSIDNNTIIFSTDFLNITDEHLFINHCLSKKIDYQFLVSYFKQHKSCSFKIVEKHFFQKFCLDRKSPTLQQHFKLLLNTLKQLNQIFIIKHIIFSNTYEKNFGNFCENQTLLEIYSNKQYKDIFLKENKTDKEYYINLDTTRLNYSNTFSYDVIIKQKKDLYGISIKSSSKIAHLNSHKNFLDDTFLFDNLSLREKFYIVFNLNPLFKNIIAIAHGKQNHLNGIKNYVYHNTTYLNIEDILNILEDLEKNNQILWNKQELTITGEKIYKIIFSAQHRGLKIDVPQFLRFLSHYGCKNSAIFYS